MDTGNRVAKTLGEGRGLGKTSVTIKKYTLKKENNYLLFTYKMFIHNLLPKRDQK